MTSNQHHNLQPGLAINVDSLRLELSTNRPPPPSPPPPLPPTSSITVNKPGPIVDDQRRLIINKNIDEINIINQPPPPADASSWPSFSAVWVKWLMGWVISFAFPFWKQQWDQFLALEAEAEMVVEEAEKVAEVVEKVALATENMSAQIAQNLPDDDDDQLKKAALFVQHVSHETAKDAKSLSNFIHKVGDLKQDVEDLETIVIKNNTGSSSSSLPKVT
ncbi:uncharacterized protein LOC124943960 [Impatiens glandulifera]|uniref:uncharacterized protein LOC124943960 n=1 Tax=Impatiens glandulifera TaxID=253017 RepID=UPI001FB0F3A5|nr:uncharacterized protein LOC124943960 [Impatiens glandulifera]